MREEHKYKYRAVLSLYMEYLGGWTVEIDSTDWLSSRKEAEEAGNLLNKEKHSSKCYQKIEAEKIKTSFFSQYIRLFRKKRDQPHYVIRV